MALNIRKNVNSSESVTLRKEQKTVEIKKN